MKPLFPTYILKRHAKAAMRGRFFKAFVAAVAPMLCVTLCTILVMAFVPEAKASFDLVINGKFDSYDARSVYFDTLMNISSSAMSLFFVIFAFISVGAQKLLLDLLRGKEVKIKNILCFYDKWYIAAIYPALSAALTFLLTNLLDGLIASGANADFVVMLSWVFQIIIYFLAAKFMFVDIILADTECKNVIHAMKASWKMVGWNTVINVVILSISFIGWIFLSAFTMGLTLIYLLPYMSLSVAALYEANRKFTEKTVQDEEISND